MENYDEAYVPDELGRVTVDRCLGETVVIGNDTVNISILEISGNYVRIGISAPRNVRIYRKELLDRVLKEPAAVDCTDDTTEEIKA